MDRETSRPVGNSRSRCVDVLFVRVVVKTLGGRTLGGKVGVLLGPSPHRPSNRGKLFPSLTRVPAVTRKMVECSSEEEVGSLAVRGEGTSRNTTYPSPLPVGLLVRALELIREVSS